MGAASAGIAAAGSIAQGIMGASQMSKAKKAIEAYKRQDLTNVADGISISTLGAEMQAKELARNTATSINALQQAGVRGVVGGIGKVQKSVVEQAQAIAADLDRQQKEREKLRAQDEARIRQMQEAREEADLAGLGQQLAVGQQNLFGGIAGLGQVGGNMAGMFGGATGEERSPVSAVSNLTSSGITGAGLTGVSGLMGGFAG